MMTCYVGFYHGRCDREIVSRFLLRDGNEVRHTELSQSREVLDGSLKDSLHGSKLDKGSDKR